MDRVRRSSRLASAGIEKKRKMGRKKRFAQVVRSVGLMVQLVRVVQAFPDQASWE